MTVTRTEQIMADVRRKIAGRALQSGERLPSIRGLARRENVSPSTVVEAYDRLAAEGVIHARRGAGFFVSDRAEPFAVSEVAPRVSPEIDPFFVSRQSLDARPDALKPGCGWLPPEWMPLASLRRAIRRLSRAEDPVLAEYGSTAGSDALRHLLARRFADEGVSAGPDRILLTGSGTQAIDLICRFLLQPGDRVLVDDPCYFNFQALLRAHRVDVIGVPFQVHGPDLDAFRQALIEHRPRLYITNSALHNPTGATMTAPVAHRLLTLAAEHDLIVVEDDIFADFEPEPSTRLACLDGLERVIRIGSFSKTLSASVRCGYIAAQPDWIRALTDLQVATSFGGPSPMAAEIVFSTLRDGSYRKHMDGLIRRLATHRRQVADRLAGLGIRPWLMPAGGFYLWCQLPDGLDSADIARHALDENMVLAPGNVFSTSGSMSRYLRFNVSQMDAPETDDILARALAKAAGGS